MLSKHTNFMNNLNILKVSAKSAELKILSMGSVHSIILINKKALVGFVWVSMTFVSLFWS